MEKEAAGKGKACYESGLKNETAIINVSFCAQDCLNKVAEAQVLEIIPGGLLIGPQLGRNPPHP